MQIDCWLQDHSLEDKTFPGKQHIDGERIISGPVGPFNILRQHWAMLSWLEWEELTCKSTPLACNVIYQDTGLSIFYFQVYLLTWKLLKRVLIKKNYVWEEQ